MNSAHNDICEQIKAEARSKAVFTESQIEQIVKIDVALQNGLIASINDLKKKIAAATEIHEIVRLEKTLEAMTCSLSHLTTEVSRIEEVNAKQRLNINELFEYAQRNNQIVAGMRDEIKDNTTQIRHLECETEKIEKAIKFLEVREFHDERVDKLIDRLQCFLTKAEMEKVIARLVILEAKEYRDERIEQIIHCLEKFETKKDADEIVKRILCLEKKKLVDDRFDQVMHELCEMRKELDTMRLVNCEQNKVITELDTENRKQAEEIVCLNSMIKRNTLALSNELQEVERHVTAEEKVDLNQNADIKFLQSELLELKRQVDRMLKAGLVKSCDL